MFRIYKVTAKTGLDLFKCHYRKEHLQESHQLQLFKANQQLLLDWTLKQSAEMGKKGLPKSKAEAESLIVEHQDWKVNAPKLTYCPAINSFF